MNKIAFLLPVLALAACGQEPAPEPAATQAAPVAPAPTLPAPDTQDFAAAFAAACNGGEPVNQATCKRAGMGSPNVVCDYSLGDDEYLRHKATLSPNADKTGWVLADPANVCTEHGAEPTETAASESQ
ncbi:hypothetical protein [Tsuneonella sp. SYSU-LHT278]|uniref:hypothetical protein n=1 Tax=Tsuneonella sediminis TaxID=3416089 RepID=UPI003F7A4D5C